MRFRLVQKWPYLLSVQIFWDFCATSHFWEATTAKRMKIDPYMQRQKCRPMTLVFGNIRYVWIFVGVPLGGSLKWEWGCRRRQFLAIWLATSSKTSDIGPDILGYMMICYLSLIRRSLCSLWNFALKLTTRKLESCGYPTVSEDPMMIAWVVFTQCQRVTDRRTDGRTDLL